MKANHNRDKYPNTKNEDVPNYAKLLKWKQITTKREVEESTTAMFPTMQSY